MASKRKPPRIEPIYTLIGMRLWQLRDLFGFPQQTIASVLGVTRAQIANVEAGRSRLMIHQLVALARFFRVPVVRLLGTVPRPRKRKAKKR